VSLNNPQIKQ